MAARDLKSYRHYPLAEADQEHEQAQATRYRVTTINWTLATEKGKKVEDHVHKNVYEFTLANLVKFIRETEDVAEDVIAIERMDQ